MKIDIAKTVMIYLCSLVKGQLISAIILSEESVYLLTINENFCAHCNLPPAVIFNYAQLYANTVFMFRWVLAENSDCLP